MKYQKGTVFVQGKRVKMWYGKFWSTGTIRMERRFALAALWRYAKG